MLIALYSVGAVGLVSLAGLLRAVGFVLAIATASLFVVIAVAVFVTVVTRGRFGHGPFDQTAGSLNGEGRFVVQVDDFGNFWDPAIAEKAIAYVDRESRTTNTIVTVFV